MPSRAGGVRPVDGRRGRPCRHAGPRVVDGRRHAPARRVLPKRSPPTAILAYDRKLLEFASSAESPCRRHRLDRPDCCRARLETRSTAIVRAAASRRPRLDEIAIQREEEPARVDTRVSVVVPPSASPPTGETLDSVFAQTCRDFEVVVVNDGCPTPSPAHGAGAYRDASLHRAGTGRPSKARNTAIAAARVRCSPFGWRRLWEPSFSLADGDPRREPDVVRLGRFAALRRSRERADAETSEPPSTRATLGAADRAVRGLHLDDSGANPTVSTPRFDEQFHAARTSICAAAATRGRLAYTRAVLGRRRLHPRVSRRCRRDAAGTGRGPPALSSRRPGER